MINNKTNPITTNKCYVPLISDFVVVHWLLIIIGSLISIFCISIIIYNYIFNFPSKKRNQSKFKITVILFVLYCLKIGSIIVLQLDINSNIIFPIIIAIKLTCSLSLSSLCLVMFYEYYKFFKEEELSLKVEKRLACFSVVIPILIVIVFYIIEFIQTQNPFSNCDDIMFHLYMKVHSGLFCFVYCLNILVFSLLACRIKRFAQSKQNICSLLLRNSLMLIIFILDVVNAVYFLLNGCFYQEQYFVMTNYFFDYFSFVLLIIIFRPSFPECSCKEYSKQETVHSNYSSSINNVSSDF